MPPSNDRRLEAACCLSSLTKFQPFNSSLKLILRLCCALLFTGGFIRSRALRLSNSRILKICCCRCTTPPTIIGGCEVGTVTFFFVVLVRVHNKKNGFMFTSGRYSSMPRFPISQYCVVRNNYTNHMPQRICNEKKERKR